MYLFMYFFVFVIIDWFYVGYGINLSVIFVLFIYGVVFSNNVYI